MKFKMKLGTIIKTILSPFVKNTKFDGCEECAKREAALNNWWTSLINWFITRVK